MEERSLCVIDISTPLLLKNKSVRNPCGTSLPIVAEWATQPFGDKIFHTCLDAIEWCSDLILEPARFYLSMIWIK